MAPSTCPIGLFEPLANGRVLERLHAAFALRVLVSYKAASSNQASRTTGAQRWELHELVEVAYFEWCCHTNDKFASVLAFMAAKAALLLLLSSAAAYRCQRVVPVRSDARTSTAVIAAERRRRIGAIAALSGIAAAPSTARAITWKVRYRRPCIRRVAAMACRWNLIRHGA